MEALLSDGQTGQTKLRKMGAKEHKRTNCFIHLLIKNGTDKKVGTVFYFYVVVAKIATPIFYILLSPTT